MSHVYADKIAKIIVFKSPSSRQYPWVGEIQTLFFINSRINLICVNFKPNDFTKKSYKRRLSGRPRIFKFKQTKMINFSR